MKALVLSRFDPLLGPKIFLKEPNSFSAKDFQDIALLMSIPTKNFFIHTFKTFKTCNLPFKIPSTYARGKFESFLVTIVIDLKSNLNINTIQDFLQSFVSIFLEFEDLYKGLDYEPKDYIGEPEKLRKVKELFLTYYKTIKPIVESLEESEHKIYLQNKQLNSLYNLSKFSDEKNLSLKIIFHQTIESIKRACEFPELINIRIIYKDREYKSINYKPSSTNFTIIREIAENTLTIDLNYLEDKVFLEEDKFFLEEVGNRLKSQIEQNELIQSLFYSINKAKTIIDSLPIGIVLIGNDKKIRMINKGAKEFIRIKKKEDIIGKKCNFNICSVKEDECPLVNPDISTSDIQESETKNDGNEIKIIKKCIPIKIYNENMILKVISEYPIAE